MQYEISELFLDARFKLHNETNLVRMSVNGDFPQFVRMDLLKAATKANVKIPISKESIHWFIPLYFV